MRSSIFDVVDPAIFVVTCHEGGEDHGLVATWVSQAALDPEHLRVTVGLSPEHATTRAIERRGSFALELLSAEQSALVALLAGRSGPGKLAGLELDRSPRFGHPLLRNTCGSLECEAIGRLETPDRWIVLADVACSTVDPLRAPLTLSRLQLDPGERTLLGVRLSADIARDARAMASGVTCRAVAPWPRVEG
jgi:flavin reductase (DIM6/NTAB) family NADH-FMN oxidoreductase RutF